MFLSVESCVLASDKLAVHVVPPSTEYSTFAVNPVSKSSVTVAVGAVHVDASVTDTVPSTTPVISGAFVSGAVVAVIVITTSLALLLALSFAESYFYVFICRKLCSCI